MKNKVIIVGGDHHNGLGLARALGVNGVEVHCVVADTCKKSFLEKSKSVKSCAVFPTEKEAFDHVLSAFGREAEKPVIIPYSDGAAQELDMRLDEFSGQFFVPSIGGIQGQLASMMDKQKQHQFAQEHQIRMAQTTVVWMKSVTSELLDGIKIPCIIKPVLSAEGDKRDIAVCRSREDLEKQIELYRSKGYFRALVQEYLSIDYEIDVFGCIMKQEPGICLIPTHTLRAWPPEGGTNSFSKIITDPELVGKCKAIIERLRDSGFYGLYDMELFVCGSEIYLNEINYRNSGDVYMALSQGYYYPYAWVCDCVGLPVTIDDHPTSGDYTMTECADLRNAVFGPLSVMQWLKDFGKCKDYALKYKGDMKPAFSRYFYYIKKMLSRHK